MRRAASLALPPLLLLLLLAFSPSLAASPAAAPRPRTSPLLSACAHGRAAEALELVAAATGDDLDAADVLGWTPLMLAAGNETLVEVAEALVAAGAARDPFPKSTAAAASGGGARGGEL